MKRQSRHKRILGCPAGRGPLEFAAAREEFLSLLEESVRMRMISDVPLERSFRRYRFQRRGGHHGQTLPHSDQNIFHRLWEKSYSELPYSRLVAAKFKTDHHEKTLSADIRALVLQLAGILDEPLADFSNFPTFLVSRLAREKVTVALSGDGGDEIFGGYEHYLAQKLARFIDFLRCARCGPGRPGPRLVPPSELKKGWPTAAGVSVKALPMQRLTPLSLDAFF